jgi:hypothetical protein
VNFSVPLDAGKAHIYYSHDGINWYNLGGNANGSKISAKTHRFTYFFAGTSDESSPDTYTINILNKTQSYQHVCLYMVNKDENIASTAWLVKKITPASESYFQWSNNYSFFWSPTGTLVPGAQVTPAQIKAGDLTNNNQITLSNSQYGYLFSSPFANPQQGNMFIEQTSDVYFNQASAGICISDSPAFTAEAQPSTTTIFDPVNYQLYIVLEDFAQGEVLDISTIDNEVPVNFSSGQNTVNATLNEDNSLIIK